MHHVKGGFTTFFCKNHPATFLEQEKHETTLLSLIIKTIRPNENNYLYYTRNRLIIMCFYSCLKAW